MATRVTSRIPVTPETHSELKQAVESSPDTGTYEELLRQWLSEHTNEEQ